ncbi:hypothetical protein JKP88DRAFT_254551 [Tribonema minus]|uniref:Uncharacterized protein n=1 Tax=Tribonema minus TaxID=303371 RepID=A0A835Z7V7_9STRA|nr:hypothetical protein JKP88DRAFT_254551 [Tribonema minus]
MVRSVEAFIVMGASGWLTERSAHDLSRVLRGAAPTHLHFPGSCLPPMAELESILAFKHIESIWMSGPLPSPCPQIDSLYCSRSWSGTLLKAELWRLTAPEVDGLPSSLMHLSLRQCHLTQGEWRQVQLPQCLLSLTLEPVRDEAECGMLPQMRLPEGLKDLSLMNCKFESLHPPADLRTLRLEQCAYPSTLRIWAAAKATTATTAAVRAAVAAGASAAAGAETGAEESKAAFAESDFNSVVAPEAAATETGATPPSLHIGLHELEVMSETSLHIPSTVVRLSTSRQDGLMDVLPATLRELDLDGKISQPLRLPPVLQKLAVLFHIHDFHGALSQLPSTLHELSLSGLGDRIELPRAWPPGLQKLKLSGSFTCSLGALPAGLKELKVRSRDFDKPLGALPASLTYIKVDGGAGGCSGFFDQELGPLPSALVRIVVVTDFNRALGPLPPLLRTLSMGECFDQSLGALPLALMHLKLGASFNQSLGALPPKLAVLSLGEDFNRPLRPLPPSLAELRISACFDQPLAPLPPALVELHVGDAFRTALGPLPAGLAHLTLGNAFDHALGLLPAGLRSLSLGDAFDRALGPLPAGLASVELGHSFSQPLGDVPMLCDVEMRRCA